MEFRPRRQDTKLLACLLILSSFAATTDARETPLRCMSCKMVLHLATCESIETCNENQVCYVEEVSALGGEVNYNAGCRDKEECDTRGCFGEVSERARRESSLHGGEQTKFREGGVWEHKTYCHHCCDSDFCNMYGCSDNFPVRDLKGSRCFNCKKAKSPELCQVIRNCDENEICFMEEINLYDSETRFNTGCMKKRMCDILDSLTLSNRRRRNVRLWSDCCDAHMCNRQNPAAEEAPSRWSIDYKCPNAFPTDNGSKEAVTEQVKSTVSTTTSQKTTSIPEIVELCEDEHDCREYGQICEGIYAPWAKIHCPKYCGFCKEPITEPVVTTQAPSHTTVAIEPCKDDSGISCSSYEKDYICLGQYAPWSKQHCPKYCGFCKGSVTEPVITTQSSPLTAVPVELCEDEHVCSMYEKDYICTETYMAWSQIHCPKYCGFCTRMSDQSQTDDRSTSELEHRSAKTMRDSGECVDREDCSIYGREYICAEDFSVWATINCPVYCELCPTTIAMQTTPTPQPCVDLEDCTIYGRDYICAPDYVPWATIHCPVYCNLCPTTTAPPTTPTPEPCEDQDSDCSIYGRDYICAPDYIPWATIHCRAYCGICKSPTTAARPTTPTPASTTAVSTTRASTSPSTTLTLPTSQQPLTTNSTPTTTHKQTTAAPATTSTTPMSSTTTENLTTTASTAVPDLTTVPPTTTERLATTANTTLQDTTTSTTVLPTTTERLTTLQDTTTSTTVLPTTAERLTTLQDTTTSTTVLPTTAERLTTLQDTTTSTTVLPTTAERLTTLQDTTTSTTVLPTTTERLTTLQDTTTSTTVPPTTTERLTTTASSTVQDTTTVPPTTTERLTTTATTTIPTTTKGAGVSCSDKQDCSHFDKATLCNDPDQVLWMYENCRASCSLCNAPAPCVDKITNCAVFGSLLCTNPAYASLKDSCQATCNLC